jgi:hypothetical protein
MRMVGVVSVGMDASVPTTTLVFAVAAAASIKAAFVRSSSSCPWPPWLWPTTPGLPTLPPPSYQPAPYQPSYKEPAYPDVAPQYNYQYAVKDDYAGVDFSANEARDNYATNGEYRVLLPDGRTQIVTYNTQDAYSGNVADVRYEGEARYEPAPSYKPAPPAYKPAPPPAYKPAPRYPA